MKGSISLLALSALMLPCSCFGTFHTASVVPFSGGLQAMTMDDQTAYCVALDTGIPASSWPGIGLSADFFTRDYSPGLFLGARLQAHRKHVADAAVEYDLVAGGGVPGRYALLLSRKAGGWEPYLAMSLRPAWDDSDQEDDDWLDIWDSSDADETSTSLTLGASTGSAAASAPGWGKAQGGRRNGSPHGGDDTAIRILRGG